MNELFVNALGTDFKEKFINDIFKTSDLEENKLFDAGKYLLFKKEKHN